MANKNYNKQGRLFIAILTSFVLIVLIIFTFIARKLYVADSKSMLTDIYIDSIHTQQEEMISTVTSKINMLNIYSNQITKSSEFKGFYNSSFSNVNVIRYAEYLKNYTLLSECDSIAVYDKRSNEFVYPEATPYEIRVFLDKAMNNYKEGSSFYAEESGRYISYITDTYNGFYVVFVMRKSFFENIFTSSDNYTTCLYWQNDFVTCSLDTNDEQLEVCGKVASDESSCGYDWINNVLYIYKSNSGFKTISSISGSLMTEYFSKTLNNISKVLYILLLLSLCMAAVFFSLSEKIFNMRFGKVNSASNSSKFLYSVLNHSFSFEMLNKDELEFLENYYRDYSYFKCFLFQCDNFDLVQKENTTQDIAYMFSKIQDLCRECCEHSGTLNVVVMRPSLDCIGIVVASKEQIENPDALIEKIQSLMESNFNLTFTCVVSDDACSVAEIDGLCKQTVNCKLYRFFAGSNSIIHCKDIVELEEIEYPAEIEQEIISCLDTNNFEKCYNYIEQFIVIIHECNANTAKKYITQLAFSIAKLSKFYNNTNDDYKLVQDIMNCETIDKCINIIAAIIPIFDAETNQNETSFLQRILNVVEQNYSNPDCDLNLIASKLNLTPHYVGHKFQKLFGKTFTVHLSEYRVEKSKKLLLETNLKISDVALKCGFNSTSYFIRTFKKYAVLTPAAFRSLNK